MLPVRQWWFIALFVYTFLFSGLALLVYSAAEASEGLGALDWPTTTAEVVTSRAVVMSYDPNGSTYAIEIRYDYQVDGVAYRGSRIKQSDITISNPDTIQEILARYPVGKQVVVHYHPKNPGNSLLEPGLAEDLWIPIFIGVIVTTVGALMTRWFFGFIRPDQSE